MEIKSIVGAKLGSLTLHKSTSTNPFEKNSFKGKAFGGNVLPFADVFQSIKPIEPPKPSKIKMLSGAVISAVEGFRTKITQPVAVFAGKVKENIIKGVDKIVDAKNSMVEFGKDVHSKIVSVFDFHKVEPTVDIGPKILSPKHINENASVVDLKATWIAENEKLLNEEGKAVA